MTPITRTVSDSEEHANVARLKIGQVVIVRHKGAFYLGHVRMMMKFQYAGGGRKTELHVSVPDLPPVARPKSDPFAPSPGSIKTERAWKPTKEEAAAFHAAAGQSAIPNP